MDMRVMDAVRVKNRGTADENNNQQARKRSILQIAFHL
jgi:hypothetical protein